MPQALSPLRIFDPVRPNKQASTQPVHSRGWTHNPEAFAPQELATFIDAYAPSATSPILRRLVIDQHVDGRTLMGSAEDILSSVTEYDEQLTHDLLHITHQLRKKARSPVNTPRTRPLQEIAEQLKSVTKSEPPHLQFSPTTSSDEGEPPFLSPQSEPTPEWDFEEPVAEKAAQHNQYRGHPNTLIGLGLGIPNSDQDDYEPLIDHPDMSVLSALVMPQDVPHSPDFDDADEVSSVMGASHGSGSFEGSRGRPDMPVVDQGDLRGRQDMPLDREPLRLPVRLSSCPPSINYPQPVVHHVEEASPSHKEASIQTETVSYDVAPSEPTTTASRRTFYSHRDSGAMGTMEGQRNDTPAFFYIPPEVYEVITWDPEDFLLSRGTHLTDQTQEVPQPEAALEVPCGPDDSTTRIGSSAMDPPSLLTNSHDRVPATDDILARTEGGKPENEDAGSGGDRQEEGREEQEEQGNSRPNMKAMLEIPHAPDDSMAGSSAVNPPLTDKQDNGSLPADSTLDRSEGAEPEEEDITRGEQGQKRVKENDPETEELHEEIEGTNTGRQEESHGATHEESQETTLAVEQDITERRSDGFLNSPDRHEAEISESAVLPRNADEIAHTVSGASTNGAVAEIASRAIELQVEEAIRDSTAHTTPDEDSVKQRTSENKHTTVAGGITASRATEDVNSEAASVIGDAAQPPQTTQEDADGGWEVLDSKRRKNTGGVVSAGPQAQKPPAPNDSTEIKAESASSGQARTLGEESEHDLTHEFEFISKEDVNGGGDEGGDDGGDDGKDDGGDDGGVEGGGEAASTNSMDTRTPEERKADEKKAKKAAKKAAEKKKKQAEPATRKS
ncbi:hypothetical protein PHLCEN_2v10008 [Hermanssonia centrifuga]|uniref:Uncharacterized protein n=1 Tax=Hermanssonia centrifuga TaxID=98765 RepID=A0A2R6NPC0_9APHY|nr:hypothetical protein PHLCEN_2v10008 [Hermanssonia centrifuga]